LHKMAFVHEQSCECAKSELDLFSVPPTQTSIESGNWVEYHPLSSVTDGSPIEFEVTGNGEDYLDFANSYLHVKAKITKAADGSNLDADAAVGPTNLFLHSLFSQVDIALNGTQITSSTNTDPYRAMIETLLSYGHDAKETQLTSAMFYKDEAGNMDSVAFGADDEKNSGLVKRRDFTSRSKEVDMMGRLHADIFFQERYMLNEVNAKIKLIKSKDAFCLMHNGAFKVQLTSATLYIRKVRLLSSVFLAHAKALETSNAKYPIHRVVCKSFQVPRGFFDVTHEKLFSGQLPSRLVIGLVSNEAYNGTKSKNPFNFQNYKLNEINVYLDGQQQQAIRPLKPNYTSGHYISSYLSLFSGTGKINRDDGNFVNRDEYANGYTLYAFDLSPDLAEDDHFNLAREGSLRVDLKFEDALPEAVTVVCYAEFENVIEIDRNRNVIFDFTS
jgi:hypothetical protein